MYTIIQTEHFTLQDFVSAMESMHPRLQPAMSEAAAWLNPTTTITSLVYHYPTLDEHGSDITMSALMLLPIVEGTCSAERLWLENRATQSANQNVPTQRWNIGEAHVLNNQVLVSPDLISFGASIAKPICYCHARLAARNTVDAVLAAQEILHERYGYDFPLPVYNSGHSQGGFDALAVHRYLETEATAEERLQIPLVRSFCADGPYVPDTLTRVIAARDKYLYGAYMVMNAISHLYYHSDCFTTDITIDNFLTDEARAIGIADTIMRKDTGNKLLVKQVISALGMKTSALFREEVYTPGGRLYEMMMRCSREERLIDGWTPRLPIYFYHAHEDECVPIECMQEVEQVWGHLPNIQIEDDLAKAEDVPNRMVHAYSGGVFHRRLLSTQF